MIVKVYKSSLNNKKIYFGYILDENKLDVYVYDTYNATRFCQIAYSFNEAISPCSYVDKGGEFFWIFMILKENRIIEEENSCRVDNFDRRIYLKCRFDLSKIINLDEIDGPIIYKE